MKRTTIFLSIAALALLNTVAAHAQDLLVGEYFSNTIYRIAADGSKTVYAQPLVPSGIRLYGFGTQSFDSAGNLYAARVQGGTSNLNDPNGGIIKVTPTGVSTIFGGFISNGAADTLVAANGDVYVSSFGGSIYRFNSAGASLGTFAVAPGGEAYRMALDASGTLFVTTYEAGKVRRFSSTGTDMGVFASVGAASGLAFDAAGDVYVGNYNGTIRRFTASGTDLGVFASLSGAAFNSLAFSNNGDLYAADLFGSSVNNVHRYSATGVSLGSFSTGINNPNSLAFLPATPTAGAAPEPSSLALLSFAALGGIARRRKTRQSAAVS